MRIVSLISSATEILHALGLGDEVLAVSHECDFPRSALDKPRATFSKVDSRLASGEIDTQVKTLLADGEPLYGLDVQLLIQLRPDLIVTQAQCDVCAVRHQDVVETVRSTPALRDTKIVALNPQSIGDVLSDIHILGRATGRALHSEAVVAALAARIAAVRRRTERLKAAQRPRTACLEWIEPPMLAGNWTPELLDWAGGQCALTQPGRHSSYCTWEDIARFDPEVVVVLPCGFNLARSQEEAQSLTRLPAWSRLAAVRNNRVFVIDGNAYFNRSGPRLVDSLELLAHLLHPELIPKVASVPQGIAWQRGL